jgi:glycosyltransferase involved in cell wall biosynthesis
MRAPHHRQRARRTFYEKKPRAPARTIGKNEPIRILELRSVRGTGGGPEKTILLGAARSDPERFLVTVCYLRDERDGVFAIDDRARPLGIDYVEVRERHSFDPAIWPRLRQLVRERAIDIVHSHDYKTNLLALLVARAEGVIPLATIHGWSGSSWRERFYYFFDRRLIARFPAVIAVSESLRRIAIAHGARPKRIRCVRNGIDHRYFRREPGRKEAVRKSLGIPAETLVLGAVGRLSREKRPDLLLAVAARLASRAPMVLFAGDGPLRNEVAARADSLGIAGRVRLLGQRDDVREIHEALDIYVQTSDDEGIPNALLEAMALETPIVATDVGGTREIVDDGVHGLLCPPGDEEALARAIERTLSDPAATARRVAAARARIERELSFEVRMAKVEAIYEELVARCGRRRRAFSPPGRSRG